MDYGLTLRKASCASIVTEYGNVAQLIVFPSSSTLLCSRLRVPPTLRGGGALILALVPWSLSPSQYASRKWRPGNNTTNFSPEADEGLLSLRTSWINSAAPTVEFSLQLLAFPEKLYNFLQTKRQYCIWAFPVETMPRDSGRTFDHGDLRPDTRALMRILDERQAENVGYKADARVIFIHVGALTTISKLPALVERRARRPEIQFYTYGYHENIKPSQWSVREIFPIGRSFLFFSEVEYILIWRLRKAAS